MKKKSVISTMLALTMTVAQLTACGNNGDSGNGSTTGGAENTTVSTEVTKEEPGDNGKIGNKATTTVENSEKPEKAEQTMKITEPEKSEAELADEAIAAFITNEGQVFIEDENLEHYDYAVDSDGTYELVPVYEKGKGYTLKELVDQDMKYALMLNTGELQEDSFLTSVSYATIDAGTDGVKELIVKVKYDLYVMEDVDFFVIKYIDGRLVLTHAENVGAYTSLEVSDTGVVYSELDYGYAELWTEKSYINAEGKNILDYNAHYTGYDQDVMDAADKMYSESDAQENEAPYAFNLYVGNYCYEEIENYDEQMKDMYFTYNYYEINELGETVVFSEEEMPSIYEEGSFTQKVLAETGKNFVKPSEFEKILKEHEESIGLTEDLKKGKAAEFTKVDLKLWKGEIYLGESFEGLELINNDGHFVKLGNIVYFNMPSEYALSDSAIFGEFYDNTNLLSDGYIMAYDEDKKEVKTVAYIGAAGRISVTDGVMVYSTIENTGNGDRENHTTIFVLGPDRDFVTGTYDMRYIGGDKEGKYSAAWKMNEAGDNEIIKIQAGYQSGNYNIGEGIPVKVVKGNVLYEEKETNGEVGVTMLKQLDLESGEITELGVLPDFENGWGEYGQLEEDGGKLYWLFNNYDGTGHFYQGISYTLEFELGEKFSLESNLTDLSGYSDERKSYAPCFKLEGGALRLVDGEPFTADIDEEGNIGYYDENGEFVAVAEGYGFVRDEVFDQVYMSEIYEYVDGAIYVVYNRCFHITEDDIGWREAYQRYNTTVIRIDCETGEEKIIEEVSMPAVG